MSYRIFTDAMCDLPVQFAQEQNISIVPMEYQMDDRYYRYRPNESEIPLETIYSSFQAGKAVQTCSISPKIFVEVFEPVLQTGEDILYIGVSGAISGTYQSAVETVRELEARYPERRIRVIDSTCVSLGEGLLALDAAQRQPSLDLDALTDWIESNKGSFVHRYVLDDTHALLRGGRVSLFADAYLSFFHIKVFCYLNARGQLTVGTKVAGRRKSLIRLVDSMARTIISDESDTIFIGFRDKRSDAEFVASLIRAKYPNRNVPIEPIGLNIGLLFGPGTIALFFVGNER